MRFLALLVLGPLAACSTLETGSRADAPAGIRTAQVEILGPG